MVFRIADNIYSPLGETTQQNYQAVIAGNSALCRYDHYGNISEPFCASMFTEAQTKSFFVEGLTRFESLAYRSAKRALDATTIDLDRNRVVFILSTTKGNIELIADASTPDVELYPGTSACHIATKLGIKTQPITVCNACISGVSAIIIAQRLLEAGCYDYAIVCGADMQNEFTISGFQSLKTLSAEMCRPFDIERLGLNLGEAAATIILSRESAGDEWCIAEGAIRNDGFHISSPSKSGDGARQSLEAVMTSCKPEDLGFINAHGTATMFNDQMESVAIVKAGFRDIPVNALKGYFGHTLGAAGILETILSMSGLDNHTILGTKGFEELGVSGKISLSSNHLSTDKSGFLKMISGFGGGNAVIRVSKHHEGLKTLATTAYEQVHHIIITPQGTILDGAPINTNSTGKEMLVELYKRHVGNYPKFYKMDGLSRLGFIAAELLFHTEGETNNTPTERRAVVLVNRSSSIAADRSYQDSIQEADNFFPSPAIFVYTLPNIVTGEIAIRHHLHGETSFYILPHRNDETIDMLMKASLQDEQTQSILGGWIDYQDELHFEADISIIKKY